MSISIAKGEGGCQGRPPLTDLLPATSYYHVAPTEQRSSIQRQGLTLDNPVVFDFLPNEPGWLYLHTSLEFAHEWAHRFLLYYPDCEAGNADIWEVRLTGPVQPDPYTPHGVRVAYGVPPEQLTLLDTYHADEH